MPQTNDTADWRPYYEIPGFDYFYLEDSFVMDISVSNDRVELSMDFVLRENHPKYHPPIPGEQYCYKKGKLVFKGVSYKTPFSGAKRIGSDPENDMGNIDVFRWKSDQFFLSGSWGELNISAESVEIVLGSGPIDFP